MGEIREILEPARGAYTVMELKTNYQKEVAAWKQFEKQNAVELAEYTRLKQKFEGASV